VCLNSVSDDLTTENKLPLYVDAVFYVIRISTLFLYYSLWFCNYQIRLQFEEVAYLLRQ
jgi:hypothetical protein